MCKMNSNIIKQIHEEYINRPVFERIVVASLICSLAKKTSNELIVVGGLATEFYTSASYMTRTIDFIARNEHDIPELMISLGFNVFNDSSWFYPDSLIIVNFLKPPLAGNIKKVIKVSTHYGFANLMGVEDLILDWFKERVFCQNCNEVPEILLLAHYNKIDFKYLREQVRNKSISDALEKAISDVDRYKKEKFIF